MKLRPYQSESCRKIVAEFEGGKRSTLLILPTGCGKTVVFNGVAFKYAYKKDRTPSGGKVLILAHQNILIDQAAQKLSSIMGLNVSKEKGKETCIGSEFPITISSVQTMQRRLNKFDPDYFDLIIIDEAHHTESSGYQKVINHFTGAKVLGVTATPDRADKKKLSSFESVAFEYTIDQAQKDGYLAPIKVVSATVAIDLADVKKVAGDLDSQGISNAIEPHLHDIAQQVRELAKDRKIVCFVPLIKTAQKAAEIFSHYGFRSTWVSGADSERDDKLKDFESGEYDIIFNAMLLTEGWDCPDTDCVIVLRPTMSRALYVQMIGRGLRLAEGKEDCLLIDFLFQNSRFKLASPKKVLGRSYLTAGESAEGAKDDEPKEGTGDGTNDREAVLKKRLEEAAKAIQDLPSASQHFKHLINRLQTDDEWFDPEATAKQKKDLISFGFNPAGLTSYQAREIIKHIKEDRMQKEKPTPKQFGYLMHHGFSKDQIQYMSKSDAMKHIRRLKARGR